MPHVLPHELRLTPIESLIPHPRNARRHHDVSLDESIAENGVYKPVVASSRSGYILAGHGLAERSRAAGIEEIPVMWIEGLDEAAELKILAVDNRASELSGYDETLLAELLESVRNSTGLQGSGFDDAAFDALIVQAGDAVFRTIDGDAEESKDAREDNMSQRAKKIVAVMFVNQVAVFENAILATGLENRGEAIMEICRFYAEQKPAR